MRGRHTLIVLLAVGVAGVLYFTAAASGHTRRAANDITDGDKLAFSQGGNIWTMNPDGSGLTQLTTDPAVDRFPSWSPDGTKIAFASKRTGNFEIWVMDANGANQHQITHDAPNNDGSPNWTADGSQLVYHLNFNSVFIINSDGTGTTQHLRTFAATPDASPQNLIAFFDTQNLGLYTMNLAGTGVTFVANPNGQGTLDPDWSPRGDRIAFVCDLLQIPTNTLCSIAPDGTGLVSLDASPDRVDFSPTWSPNAMKIAFVGCLNFFTVPDCNIYMVKADGTHLRQLTTSGGLSASGGVDWGPDTAN